MQWIIVVAALAAMGSSLESPNANTIQAQCVIVQQLSGQTINQALMEKLLPQMMGFYAPMVDCSQVATNEEFGFSLQGVPVSACFAEGTKKWGGMKVLEMRCEDIAADDYGKSVMVYTSSTFSFPNGQTVSLPGFMKYDFNDEGKIVSYTTQFDASAFDVGTPAVTNVATIRNQCDIFKEMEGQTISDTLLATLVPQMMTFYAPSIDCNQVATSEEFGFELKDVPVSQCFSEAAGKYGGMQIVGNECKDIAADEDGKSVMVYFVVTFKTTTGQTIDAPIFTKYDFNDDGKIVSYTSQFDTSVLEVHNFQFQRRPHFAMETPAMKNSATLMFQCKIFQEMMQGQTINDALMQQLMQGMMGFYAPTINCDQVATSAEFGFKLRDVPVAECFGAASEKYGGIQIVSSRCDDIAADRSGKSAMTYMHSVFRLLNGQTVSVPIMAKYDFNDEGKIVAYSTQFDTSVLEANGPPRSNVLQPQYPAGLATAALRNMASVKEGCRLMQEMTKGQTVNQAFMEKLVGQMMGFYAPTINCNQVATNPELGFSLHGVPVATCFAEGTKKYGGMKIVDFLCEDIAADETGKSVMVYQPWTFEMPSGQMISLPGFSKYDFNDEGKIAAYSTQFDTSVFTNSLPQYQHGQYGAATTFSPAAMANSATIKRLCGIFQEMMGQTVSQSLVEQLNLVQRGFYAPAINCDQVLTSSEFGFSFSGVDVSTCTNEIAAKFAGTQIVQLTCEDVTADQSGRSVMLFQPTTLRMTTGQTSVLPIVTKYNFNDDGLIVGFSTQFDTSVFAPQPVLLSQEASTMEWSPWSGAVLLLAFSLGCFVAMFAMRVVGKKQTTPLSQEGYNPCA